MTVLFSLASIFLVTGKLVLRCNKQKELDTYNASGKVGGVKVREPGVGGDTVGVSGAVPVPVVHRWASCHPVPPSTSDKTHGNAQFSCCSSQPRVWQTAGENFPRGHLPASSLFLVPKTLTVRADSVPPLFTASHGSQHSRVGGRGGQISQCSVEDLDSLISNVPIPNSHTACNILPPSPLSLQYLSHVPSTQNALLSSPRPPFWSPRQPLLRSSG